MMTLVAGFVAPTPVLARNGFCGSAVCSGATPAVSVPAAASSRRAANIHMRSAINLEKKVAKVARVRENLEDAEFVFSVPLPGITMKQMTQLKSSLPAGTTAQTVKNTLMIRAIEGTAWDVVGDLCVGSSVWFFVREDIKESVAAFNSFAKVNKRDDTVNGGAMDNIAYDAAGVKAISELPSKKELYASIAFLMKAVPQKLAKTINVVPIKVARAINLAFATEDDDAPAETLE
jgi:large subunit ribosomal protein L10